MNRRRPLVLAAAAVATLLLGGCGSSSSGAGGPADGAATSSAGATPAPAGSITVLAAASLTGSFTELAHRFEAAHPGSKVVLSFGASSTLAQQALAGAPADVFASASQKNMDQVVQGGAAGAPRVFARNVMELAVPPADPAGISGLADLARPGVKLVLCQPQVPCGALAATVLQKAGVTAHPVSLETDVKATLTKVELGEADAGIVYVTDVKAAGSKVKGISIPAAVNASTDYPVAVLKDAPNSALAEQFVSYLLSEEGSSVLAQAGFEKP
ncbi:MAG TPA: molybdate ABC transporter substrate-binding protein [Motilibacteraceae bacterium]|nr:molybdate ABC transporter substrate-binding protein [Motilibacteraceae bacterium]